MNVGWMRCSSTYASKNSTRTVPFVAFWGTSTCFSLAQALASSGFRDTTRLALSNLEMANDMVSMNTVNIKEAYKDFKASFECLIGSDYKQQANEIKQFRKNLYD